MNTLYRENEYLYLPTYLPIFHFFFFFLFSS